MSSVADGLCSWFSLAAAPTFAAMAVLTVSFGPSDGMCGSASQFGGMVPMYGLMSAFHLAPWLKLIAGRRRGDLP